MGNKAPCCGAKNSSLNESNISTSESGWKQLLRQELKGYSLETTLTWPTIILSAIRQFTPIRPEKSFISFSRWYDFLSLQSGDVALQFNPMIHDPNHNFFDYLTEDFYCPDNPVGLIIVAFSQGFIADFHDPVQDLLTNPQGVNALYAKMLDSITKFKSIAYKLICEFYKNVAAVVQCQLEDAEALLLSFTLQGEVYRLIYTAAWLCNAQSSRQIKHVIDELSERDPFALGELDATHATAIEVCVKSIRLLGASESPFEKVMHLDAAVIKIHEANDDSQTRTKLLADAIVRSKLTTVLGHIKLIDDFVSKKRAGLTIAIKQAAELIHRLS